MAARCSPAIGAIRTNVAERTPGAPVARVLVQPMVAGLGEVLLGYRVDRDVGPLVMLAAGGVLTEIERDRSLRLAPVDLAGRARHDCRGTRRSTRSPATVASPRAISRRWRTPSSRLSRLAEDAVVAEAEINPLIVRPAGEGVVAVDALVRLMV